MGEDVRDFKDLVIWQRAMSFATEVYNLSKHFPADERFGLTAQVRRAAVSVASNIAEGHARHGREFPHFLSIARGSLAEAETQLLLAVNQGYLHASQIIAAQDLATEIRRMSAALLHKLAPNP